MENELEKNVSVTGTGRTCDNHTVFMAKFIRKQNQKLSAPLQFCLQSLAFFLFTLLHLL